jgi:GDP/UDP-N,N'-diacetylbacillosamine 2-epimerase (hydrolysing)
LNDVKNPYDNGLPSKKIVKVLKNLNLENILKKNFYDIDYSL